MATISVSALYAYSGTKNELERTLRKGRRAGASSGAAGADSSSDIGCSSSGTGAEAWFEEGPASKDPSGGYVGSSG